MKLRSKILIAVMLVIVITAILIALFWGDQEATSSILAGGVVFTVLAPCGVLVCDTL